MRHTAALVRIMALVVCMTALLLIPALLFAALAGERWVPFAAPLAAVLLVAGPPALFLRTGPIRLSPREGFLVVFLTWAFATLLGAAPYLLSGLGIGAADSIFESAAAFATTGGTTIADLEALPRSLHLWRSVSHWAGGMGIVLLSVALMPLFGVGGFQLVKAETPGPEKEKITPRVAASAKIIWIVYSGLTITLIGLYRIGGMGWFDAFCHGLTTMATGGVSTRNGGIASFGSAFIEGTTVVFMLLSALNFNLYYRLLKGRWHDVWQSTEFRVYLGLFAGSLVIVTWSVLPLYGSLPSALRYASFQTASILSSSGSASAPFDAWPPLAQAVLFCLMFVGGCSGSTAGGLKVIRCAVLFKQARNEIRRILYPQGIFSIQLNRKVGRLDLIYGVAGFVFLYFFVILCVTLVTALSGVDLFTSFSAAVAMLGNMGVGFGGIAPGATYGAFAPHIKLLYALVMIAGRLELWTVFVLFTPGYWRR
ncbi:MAG: TrkH family potassium uptake protein [Treponema sp.]|jgi:trk system potassium uptake protein TrkH|nr:TrkH family potassium uptake protein [Treponema sp.]